MGPCCQRPLRAFRFEEAFRFPEAFRTAQASIAACTATSIVLVIDIFYLADGTARRYLADVNQVLVRQSRAWPAWAASAMPTAVERFRMNHGRLPMQPQRSENGLQPYRRPIILPSGLCTSILRGPACTFC